MSLLFVRRGQCDTGFATIVTFTTLSAKRKNTEFGKEERSDDAMLRSVSVIIVTRFPYPCQSITAETGVGRVAAHVSRTVLKKTTGRNRKEDNG